MDHDGTSLCLKFPPFPSGIPMLRYTVSPTVSELERLVLDPVALECTPLPSRLSVCRVIPGTNRAKDKDTCQ
jgi:hypothetical protein